MTSYIVLLCFCVFIGLCVLFNVYWCIVMCVLRLPELYKRIYLSIHLCLQSANLVKTHNTDLVDVVTWYGVVERTVEVIQQFDDLYRTTFRRQRCEPDYIWEVDRHARIHLWSDTTSCLQLIRHGTMSQTNYCTMQWLYNNQAAR